MAQRFDILSFSLRLDWEQDRSHAVQRYLVQLCKDRKVLNLNPPLGWRQALTKPGKPALRQIQPNLWHFEWGALCPVFYRPDLITRTIPYIRRVVLTMLMRYLALKEPIYIVWGVEQYDVVLSAPRRFTVYFAYDQFDAFRTKPEWIRRNIAAEEKLANIASLAFGVSRPIVDALRSRGFHDVHYLPNGIDYNLYECPMPEPDDMRNVPHPRAVLVAGTGIMLDIPIMLRIAARLPAISFVVIGLRKYTGSFVGELSEFLRLPNVYYIGFRPRESVPAYVQHCDIGLAPYLLSGPAVYASPLKVYEYLAAGIPVVSSPIPEVVAMGDHVYCAGSEDEWVQQIKRSLAEADVPALVDRRRAYAEKNSWEQRAKRMIEIIGTRYHT